MANHLFSVALRLREKPPPAISRKPSSITIRHIRLIRGQHPRASSWRTLRLGEQPRRHLAYPLTSSE